MVSPDKKFAQDHIKPECIGQLSTNANYSNIFKQRRTTQMTNNDLRKEERPNKVKQTIGPRYFYQN